MAALTLSSVQKLLVVGPIWDKIHKLSVIQNILDDYDWVILNGGLCHSLFNKSQLDCLDLLLQSGKVIYNVDNINLSIANQTNVLNPNQLQIEKWIRNKPNVVLVNFTNSFHVNIVNGGLPLLSSRKLLEDNLEVSFIKHNWHLEYSGGLGYTISNYPLTQWAPQFHRYSVQIGNTVHPESQVYALSINQYGVQRTIIL